MPNTDSSELSKLYEKSEKIRVTLEGKKLDKIRREALEEPESFWGEQAKNLIWFKEWDRVLEWDNPPFARWFAGGMLNASVNCLD